MHKGRIRSGKGGAILVCKLIVAQIVAISILMPDESNV